MYTHTHTHTHARARARARVIYIYFFARVCVCVFNNYVFKLAYLAIEICNYFLIYCTQFSKS